MRDFLDHIVEHISEADLPALKDRCYVFPTRRSGNIYFKNKLAHQFRNNTFWAPAVFSIKEFAEHCSKQKVVDELPLLLELHALYQSKKRPFEENEELSFDQFLPWGSILLKDFDEIDKYLVDASKVYTSVYDIQELEATMGVESEAVEIMRTFRSVLSAEEKSKLLMKFLEIWKLTGTVYFEFKKTLQEKGIAYEGMLYRSLVEKLRKDPNQVDFQEIHFCGFNALSTAEEEIIDLLTQAGKAVSHWDADRMFLNPIEKHEGGHFLRSYYKKWQPTGKTNWITTDLLQQEQKLKYISTSGTSLQIAAARDELKVLSPEELGKTVVVLADESLLPGFLYQLPPQANKLNVTMGFPFGNSGLPKLITDYLDLLILSRKSSKDTWLPRLQTELLLGHPYIFPFEGEKIREVLRWMQHRQLSFVPHSKLLELLGEGFVSNLLTFKGNASETLEHLIDVSLELFKHFHHLDKESKKGSNQEGDISIEDLALMQSMNQEEPESNKNETQRDARELEFIFQLNQELKRFRELMSDKVLKMDINGFKKVLLDRLSKISVPFSDPKPDGLQIMGFLETRLLDFERVIIVGVNEGSLPAARRSNTYIPYSVRRAFQMPTFEEQDAIYSYHFYRLMQRAKEVCLIYNSDAGQMGSSEKSRYLPQWEYLRRKVGKTVTKIKYQQNPETLANQHHEIAIKKSPEIMERLQEFTTSHPESTRSLSASALSNYINCPLQFYFASVAKMREVDEYRPDMDAKTLGSIVHKTIENLYIPFVGKVLEKEALSAILRSPDRIQNALNSALRTEYYIDGETKMLSGYDVTNSDIIFELVKKVVEYDRDQKKEIKILDLEQVVETSIDIGGGIKIRLKGIIDRLQETQTPDGATVRQVVDYKTGTYDQKPKAAANFDSFLMKMFEDSKFNKDFQILFYAFLSNEKQPLKNFQAGIFSLKKIQKGIQFLPPNEYYGNSEIFAFMMGLREILENIMNPSIPFKQTEDKKRCLYCPYSGICNISDVQMGKFK